MPVLSRYGCNHAASLRMSLNADVSIPLKCLALDKKSIKQLCPCVPRRISALELLLFCYFHILLVYHYLWNVNFTVYAQSLSNLPWECLLEMFVFVSHGPTLFCSKGEDVGLLLAVCNVYQSQRKIQSLKYMINRKFKI